MGLAGSSNSFRYMVTVILSLPKQIIFVILGSPTNKGKTGAKVGKVIAFGVLALVTRACTKLKTSDFS